MDVSIGEVIGATMIIYGVAALLYGKVALQSAFGRALFKLEDDGIVFYAVSIFIILCGLDIYIDG